MNNVLTYGDQFRILYWESSDKIDLPFYNLLTFVLSLHGSGGETVASWIRSVSTRVPSLLQHYARGLDLSQIDLARLLPLALANWFYLLRTDGRDTFATRSDRTVEHYFEHIDVWDQGFLGSEK